MNGSPAQAPPGVPRVPALLPALAALLLLLPACGPDEGPVEITATRTVEKGEVLPPGGFDSADRFGFRARRAPEAEPPAYAWTLPEGWEELPPTPSRPGNFRVGKAPDMRCYVSVLRGTGGGLAANLNRWRRQMGKPPLTEEEMKRLPRIPFLGHAAPLLDVTGTFSGMGGEETAKDHRLLGTAMTDGGYTVFLKMVGPAAEVAAAEKGFRALAGSLRRSRPRGGDPRRPLLLHRPGGVDEGEGPAAADRHLPSRG